jgi:hypothetical protein
MGMLRPPRWPFVYGNAYDGTSDRFDCLVLVVPAFVVSAIKPDAVVATWPENIAVARSKPDTPIVMAVYTYGVKHSQGNSKKLLSTPESLLLIR